MPGRATTQGTFQYQDQTQITPQVLQANPGAFPAQTGQTLFNPKSMGVGGLATQINPNLLAPKPVKPAMGVAGYALQATGAQQPAVLPVQPQPSLNQASPFSQQGQYLGQGVYLPSNVPTLPASAGHPDPGLILRLKGDPNAAATLANMPPAQRDAVERTLTQSMGGGGPQPKGPPVWTKEGYAPNGVNAQGQRLDSSGNVWDPKTAQVDIYGDPFVMKDQGAGGWGGSGYRTAKYGGGGWKKPEPKIYHSMGVVNFNVSSG